MDTVDKATRSKIMAQVGQRDTGPEMRLRKALHRIGLRYRLHDKRLLGSPDIVFPRFRAVIFVHGCFWHRHGCKASTMPETHRKFWTAKFEANIERDLRNTKALLKDGWRVMVFWECALKGKKADMHLVARKVIDWLHSNKQFAEYGGSIEVK
ncbi:MAG: very short patch repair endonuclease [Deltaproteobacteria bacterium GWA2_54_12]|nr:MAG: very short patch repair endonuclease [Deltaproteobacteria bacterium GWA2_54_12]